MNRMFAYLALSSLLWTVSAVAHRGHASLSVVELDADTGALLVRHRMAAHDVEPAIQFFAPDAQRSLDDPAAQSALQSYIANSFGIWDGNGIAIPLTYTETVLAGDDVQVIFRGTLGGPSQSLFVDSNLFESIFADQENQVNVRQSGITKTALFRKGTDPKRIAFDNPPQ